MGSKCVICMQQLYSVTAAGVTPCWQLYGVVFCQGNICLCLSELQNL